jgi:selenocysteine lyase/cysteine desulfurase
MSLSNYRKEFPILSEKIHLGNCSQAPQSIPVLNAMDEYFQNWRKIGMDWDYWMTGVEQAKASFAKLIHAKVDEIAVVSCVSDAVTSIASTFPWQNRKKVITTEAEFPSVGHVWNSFAKKGLVDLEFISSDDGLYSPEQLDELLNEDTALVSLHHVGYYNGAKQDVKAFTKKAHEHGAKLFVDAYQSLGTCDINVKELDIDMLASGNLKYLLGIPGVAFLYVKRELAEQIEPAMTGWFGRVNPFYFDATHLDFAEGAKRFNTGTPPVIAAFAARGGMDFILDVGMDRIEKRLLELSQFTLDGANRRGLEIASPLDALKKGASTAIRVGDAHRVESYLAENQVIGSARADVIRLAPHFFTEEHEIDRALDLVAESLKQ